MKNSQERPVRAGSEAGYSLVELLVSTAVAVLMLGGLYQALFFSQATQEATMDITAMRQQARVVLNTMSAELRMAGYDLGSAPEMLEFAGARRITFVADIDDGDPSPPCGNADETAAGGGAERITYFLGGDDIFKTLDCRGAGGWANEYTNQLVAQFIQNTRPIFRYFDENGNELFPGAGTLTAADRDLVRVVEIQIDGTDPDIQVIGDANVDFEINSAVRLRNAGF